MAWRPIATDEGLAGHPPASLDERVDRVLLRAYLAADDAVPDPDREGDRALDDAVEHAHTGRLGLFGGLARLGWTIAHVVGAEDADVGCAAIDAEATAISACPPRCSAPRSTPPSRAGAPRRPRVRAPQRRGGRALQRRHLPRRDERRAPAEPDGAGDRRRRARGRRPRLDRSRARDAPGRADRRRGIGCSSWTSRPRSAVRPSAAPPGPR